MKISEPRGNGKLSKLLREIVQRLNAWDAAEVLPSSAGQFRKGAANVVLDLTALPRASAPPRRELSTVASAGAAVNVAYGTVNGYAATAMTNSAAQPPYSVTLAVANTQIIVANLTLSYAATYGIWSMTSWTIAVATALPAATATNAYIPLAGPISVSAGAVTNIAGGDGGSKGFSRCGNDTIYADNYWLDTP